MPRKAILCALLACVSFAASAHGPSRQKVVETVTINAPAAKVWAMVADFCSIKDWHPGVVECTGEGGNAVGATRVLTIGEPGGPQIHEELLKYDPEGMTYKYKITQTVMDVLPVTTYSSFFTVKDNGDDTSTVEWKGGFYRGHPNNDPPPEQNDEAAVKAVTATYQGGLAELKKLAEQ
ncbi:MAG: SRPBCC family protein [Gammaproteobacteria bacterium]|nr:SRPBCC family protein [Gammaproteobacteria bacterium]MCP5198603.1 SRPBCC family protein [Gammaproteobacteria bacterium]